jgi:hypothetical protein
MPELFDMIVGSETGAIIASTLVIPSLNGKTNKYFAKDAVSFFSDNIDELYVDSRISESYKVFTNVVGIILVCGLVYLITESYTMDS